MEHVILVDEQDNEVGTMEKLEAHQRGLLHRAFSVVLFNSQGDILLQKRALSKYHSGGLWTNTCCSHPMPEETVVEAANRKLQQEMGINITPNFRFKFQYQVALDNNLIENEIDYVLTGIFDGEPKLNKDEASDWRFVKIDTLLEEIERSPEQFTAWFKIILNHPKFHISI